MSLVTIVCYRPSPLSNLAGWCTHAAGHANLSADQSPFFLCGFHVFQQRVSKRSQRLSIIHLSSSQQQPTNNHQPTTTNQQRPTNCNNRQPRPPPTLFVFIVPTICCLLRPTCARTNAARRNDHHRLTMALSPCPCPANKHHPTMSFCSLVACCLTSCVPLHLDLD